MVAKNWIQSLTSPGECSTNCIISSANLTYSLSLLYSVGSSFLLLTILFLCGLFVMETNSLQAFKSEMALSWCWCIYFVTFFSYNIVITSKDLVWLCLYVCIYVCVCVCVSCLCVYYMLKALSFRRAELFFALGDTCLDVSLLVRLRWICEFSWKWMTFTSLKYTWNLKNKVFYFLVSKMPLNGKHMHQCISINSC